MAKVDTENSAKTDVDFQKMIADLQATLASKNAELQAKDAELATKDGELATMTNVNAELQTQVELTVLSKITGRPTLELDGKNYEVMTLKFKHEDQEYETLKLNEYELGKNILRAILQRPGQRLLVEITK